MSETNTYAHITIKDKVTFGSKHKSKENRTLWTPFVRCNIIHSKILGREIDLRNERIPELGTQEIWQNNRYQVMVYRGADVPQHKDFYQLIWLSIRRMDRQPLHDWRDLQRIKNELVGQENEAIELYPAESRLVDMANQYHLWVMEDAKIKMPFGWTSRMTGTPEEAEKIGAKQRK